MSRWLEQRSPAIALTDEEFYVVTALRGRNLTDGPISRRRYVSRVNHYDSDYTPTPVGQVAPNGIRCYLDRQLSAEAECEVRALAATRAVRLASDDHHWMFSYSQINRQWRAAS